MREFNTNSRFKTAHSRIIHQYHVAETLIIDLDSGHYYCLEGSAPAIWEYAVTGTPGEQIVCEIDKNFSPLLIK